MAGKKLTRQEYDELSKTEDGRALIVRNYKRLINSKGWQMLMLYFEAMYESGDRDLHNIRKEMTDQQLHRMRERLYYIKEIMDTPENIIANIVGSKDRDDNVVDDIY